MEVECNKNKNIKQIFYRFCRDVEKIKMPDNMEKAAVADGESNGGEWAEIAAMPSYEDKMKAAEVAQEAPAEDAAEVPVDIEDGTVKKRPLMESHPGLESDLNPYPDPNMYPLEDPETPTTPPDEGPQFPSMTPPMEEPTVGMTELPVVDEDGNPNTVNLENEPAPERHEMTSEELDAYMQQLMGRGAKVMAAAETPVAAETVEEIVVAEAPEAVAPTTEVAKEIPAYDGTWRPSMFVHGMILNDAKPKAETSEAENQ